MVVLIQPLLCQYNLGYKKAGTNFQLEVQDFDKIF